LFLALFGDAKRLAEYLPETSMEGFTIKSSISPCCCRNRLQRRPIAQALEKQTEGFYQTEVGTETFLYGILYADTFPHV
jgi:hypothetical protein